MTAIFNFNGTDLRTIEIEGAPWFVAIDVLKCLGLRTGNGEHYKKLGADEQTSSSRTALGMAPGKPMRLVSESGLYKLIMRSDKATARPFQDWVTKEVLPSIRKTGGYQASAEQPMDPLMQGLSQFIAGLITPMVEPLRAEVVSLRAYVEKLNALIEKLASGDAPADVWLSGDLVTEMTDLHIQRAIKWAQRNRTNHDVLLKERARRNRNKRAA